MVQSLKLRRERSAAGRQEMEQRREEARRKRFDELLEKVKDVAGSEGEVEIALRMPDGSQVKGRGV